jgi:putative nucleotidyltransferase with HDIG domain
MNLKKGFTFIDSIEDLSAMPSLALDVMAMLNDTTSTINNIVGKLKLDQAMVSSILRTCNSPLYGIRTEVTSISMAVSLLGFTNLKSILMAYFMRNLYRLSGKNKIKESLWKHSISVAVFSKNLANKPKMDPEEAYLAGLLHDIGKIVLYLDDSSKYEKIIKIEKTGQEDFFSAEKRLLEYSHVDIGYFLLEKWKFSRMLKEVVLYHHDPQSFRQDNSILGVVAFANQLSHVFLEKRYGDVDPFITSFKLSEKELDKIVRESTVAIEEYYSIL